MVIDIQMHGGGQRGLEVRSVVGTCRRKQLRPAFEKAVIIIEAHIGYFTRIQPVAACYIDVVSAASLCIPVVFYLAHVQDGYADPELIAIFFAAGAGGICPIRLRTWAVFVNNAQVRPKTGTVLFCKT